MTFGYLIPLAGESRSHASRPAGCSSRAGKDRRHAAPAPGARLADAGALIVKFINPWVVKTPPGYSTLFLPPLNQFDVPFQVISGLVEPTRTTGRCISRRSA